LDVGEQRGHRLTFALGHLVRGDRRGNGDTRGRVPRAAARPVRGDGGAECRAALAAELLARFVGIAALRAAEYERRTTAHAKLLLRSIAVPAAGADVHRPLVRSFRNTLTYSGVPLLAKEGARGRSRRSVSKPPLAPPWYGGEHAHR